jgi:hypothetical protein
MSAVIETFIICDGGCGRNFGTDSRSRSVMEQRDAAKQNGWTRYQGKDLCHQCRPQQRLSINFINKYKAL